MEQVKDTRAKLLPRQEPRERDYILCDGLAPLSFSLQVRDKKDKRLLFVDKDNHSNEALRYSRNHPSPFENDQDGTAIIEPIDFEDGKFSAGIDNPNVQYFLLHHPENVINGGKTFFEHNPAADAKARVEESLLELKAKSAVLNLSDKKMLAIARVHLEGNIEKMSSDELRMNLISLAGESPEEFLEILDDPDLDVSNVAALAFEKKFVTFRGEKDIFYNLEDNKSKIITVPFDRDKIEVLSSWLKTNDGKDFYLFLAKKFA